MYREIVDWSTPKISAQISSVSYCGRIRWRGSALHAG